MSTPELWHFRISHYNEKVRWALDHKGIVHRRHAVLPGPHVPRLLWLTGQQEVPALRLDGRMITDSTRIIAALEAWQPAPPLYPADPAERTRALALEEFFDEELGPDIRRWFFAELLPQADDAAACMAVGTSSLVQSAYRACFPLLRPVLRRNMGLDAAAVARSVARMHAALDRLERELDGRSHLVGDAFSVADLTAAALFVPLVRPPEFPYPHARLPESAHALRNGLADRPGFRWVEETYRRHRGRARAAA